MLPSARWLVRCFIMIIMIIMIIIIIIIIIVGPVRPQESQSRDVGRGAGDAVGNPHQAQIVQFESFELILLLKLDKQVSVEQFEPTVSQSTVPSPPLKMSERCLKISMGQELLQDGLKSQKHFTVPQKGYAKRGSKKRFRLSDFNVIVW